MNDNTISPERLTSLVRDAVPNYNHRSDFPTVQLYVQKIYANCSQLTKICDLWNDGPALRQKLKADITNALLEKRAVDNRTQDPPPALGQRVQR